MTYFAHHPQHTSQVLAGLQGLSPLGLLTRFQTWNEERRTRNALHALTDRELSDIGLQRCDIERAVKGQR